MTRNPCQKQSYCIRELRTEIESMHEERTREVVEDVIQRTCMKARFEHIGLSTNQPGNTALRPQVVAAKDLEVWRFKWLSLISPVATLIPLVCQLITTRFDLDPTTYSKPCKTCLVGRGRKSTVSVHAILGLWMSVHARESNEPL